MAACDYAEFVTSGAPYTAASLGGEKNQKAFLAWALMVVNNTGLSDGSIKNLIFNNGPPDSGAIPLLKGTTLDQIRAGKISTILAAATRAGVSVPSTLSAKIAAADYLYQVDDLTIEKLIDTQLCGLLSTLIP